MVFAVGALLTARLPTGGSDMTRAELVEAKGVRGLQRGLQLGIVRETCFNAVRIGHHGPLTLHLWAERLCAMRVWTERAWAVPERPAIGTAAIGNRTQ